MCSVPVRQALIYVYTLVGTFSSSHAAHLLSTTQPSLRSLPSTGGPSHNQQQTTSQVYSFPGLAGATEAAKLVSKQRTQLAQKWLLAHYLSQHVGDNTVLISPSPRKQLILLGETALDTGAYLSIGLA